MATMRPLHIAMTADPYLPVPPRFYGGIERVIALLADGLVARGHRVTLVAHPDSRTAATLVGYGVHPHTGMVVRCREMWQVGSALLRLVHGVDLVHSFGRLAALLPVLPLRRLPKLQTYQRDVPWKGVARATRLAGASLSLTGCSTSLYADAPARDRWRWHTVLNGVDLGCYHAVLEVPRDAPLVFLGRIERIKGVHTAIQIARASGRRLLIAGNAPDPVYFAKEVAPHLGGPIDYLGEVDDEAKNALLGAAAALLMPIEWEEPFGIVMAEAMACGTPVIGFSRGSVPEVVRDGITGYVVADATAACQAVARLPAIDRAAVRRDCVQRFGSNAMVDGYERVYARMLGA